MGGFIKRDVQRVPITALNTKVNKEVFNAFKDCCKRQGYQLNIILETFMYQYSNGRFELNDIDILKFKRSDIEVETLNTTFNKEIYLDFKYTCRSQGFFVKQVLTAFMEKYVNGRYVLEFVDRS